MANKIWSIIQPCETYEKFITEDIRPDGRTKMEFRETKLDIGSIKTADGSALVRIGNTSVICGIKAELSQPTAAQPNNGIFVPNVELPPLCAAQFKPGPPSNMAQTHSQLLYDIFHSCKIIDLEELCICKDKLVWTLYCDLICLNYDGNVTDACILAQTAALQNLILPTVKYNEEDGTITKVDNLKQCKISTNSKPISTTFSIFEETYVILDTTSKEENITSGSLTIVTDEDDNICYINRPGGALLTMEQMEELIQIAIKQGSNKRKLIV